MGEQAVTAIVTIVTAIVGVAILSVFVSRNSNTAGVITAAGGALAQDLTAAVSPVTGNSASLSAFNFGNNFQSPQW